MKEFFNFAMKAVFAIILLILALVAATTFNMLLRKLDFNAIQHPLAVVLGLLILGAFIFFKFRK